VPQDVMEAVTQYIVILIDNHNMQPPAALLLSPPLSCSLSPSFIHVSLSFTTLTHSYSTI